MTGLVRETPLVASALGWLKLESLQRTGSFKLRGAVRALEGLSAPHVVAASAGNHGLGLACAGAAKGVKVTIVVPESSAQKKRDGIASYGAELIIDGAQYDDAERAARVIAAERGLPFVSPFDDDSVIAGNGGSLADELLRQRPSLRRVVVPVGGGGLVSGLLEVCATRGIDVIGVQPRSASAMARSLEQGRAVTTDEGATICSGLDGGISERTFGHARRHDLRVVLVDERDVLPAMAYAYRALGQVMEPASAVVIAAALRDAFPVDETAFVITGGNVDAALLDRALESAQKLTLGE